MQGVDVDTCVDVDVMCLQYLHLLSAVRGKVEDKDREERNPHTGDNQVHLGRAN